MKIYARTTFVFVAAFLLVPLSVMADYSVHPDAHIFTDRMVSEYKLERSYVKSLLQNASKQQSIIDAMTRPAEKVKTWEQYRKIFIQERRIDQGVKFWLENFNTLARASKEYNVAPEVIVAIIGVETSYGRNKGNYRVIDALATLSFDYPKRSVFFTKQLENFLLLCVEQNQDPLTLKGSYAGAMGYGQFIPSSYRSYAVDFDGDGFSDIWNNKTDAIGSVANYFSRHGWKVGEEVIVPASFSKDYDSSLVNKLKLNKTIGELGVLGFSPAQILPTEFKALPVLLKGMNGEEFWLGLHNFYVITRYNHSHLYAMAVHELSQLILERTAKNKRQASH
jgi:membrane-bound lytic murein transglycosylase B|tara:strand:- start:5826 stop:6833 length:1008 start_codon:yes stop_codon:yes gene_type:complete